MDMSSIRRTRCGGKTALLTAALGSSLLLAVCAFAAPVSSEDAPAAATKPRTPEDAVTPVPKDLNRHAQFLERIKDGPVDLVFFGDSITDHWSKIGELSWAEYAPYHPANFGVSADQTSHVLWRINNGELDGIHPRVAVVLIGTNNLGRNLDEKPEWTAAGIKKIVDTIHQKLPETKVLLLGIFPRFTRNSPLRERVLATNQIIARFADGDQTRFLDIGDKFLDSNGEIPLDIMPDRVHPSAKGYHIWHDAMAPTLDEMMH